MAEKKYTSDEMQKWLIEKASQAKDPKIARKIVISNDMRGRSTAMLGRMYFFKYTPIGRYTLPKYDKFPMCIPIERTSNGFVGLNLHYLGSGQRSALLELLLQFKSEAIINDQTRIKANYSTIKAFTALERLASPCIHRYVFQQVRSKFIEIYPSEFEMAIQLPVEDWVFNQ